VAGHEQVEWAFLGIGIAHEAAARADRIKTLETAGDELVGINLMAGVPNQAVFSEIERQVQGKAQLNDAEVAGEMRGPDAEDPNQLVAHLLGEL
jgi:hypothetical protein